MKTRKQILKYWSNPILAWRGNNPMDYRKEKEYPKSYFLLKEINKLKLNKNIKILEVGCNIGRNLEVLRRKGYNNLSGIEISKRALKLMEKYFNKLSIDSKIYQGDAEEVIKQFKYNEFDLVFTMAVLQHIHPDSLELFKNIVKITKYLITIEEETGTEMSNRHFQRNYKEVFENLGMEQIKEINCKGVKGLTDNFVLRLFKINK